MKIQNIPPNTVKLWCSKNDIDKWVHRPGNSWPCSTLLGSSIFAEFYNGDLIDFNCSRKNSDVDAWEFNAFIFDIFGTHNPQCV